MYIFKYVYNFTTFFLADSCSSNPNYCNNNGFCVVNGYGNPSCACLTGFSGLTCSFNESLCSTNEICQNGGTCRPIQNTLAGYFCSCPPSYTGINCAGFCFV
jgi:hypothetical protein